MAYTTVVAGTTITASWANANVRDQVVTPFATAAARNSAISSPVEGMYAYTSDSNYSWVYNGSVWVNVTPQGAIVATSQNGTGTSFTDLGTVGPAVTVDTATAVVVSLSGAMQNSGANYTTMTFAVSGATTRVAVGTEQVATRETVTAYIGRTSYVSGLTAGSNVFTAKYAVTAGTGTWADRNIIIQAIP